MNHDTPATGFRIGICGSYGGMNLGDEAILEVIIRELRRHLPVSITVFSRNPGDTRARHQVERAVPVRELSRAALAEEIRSLDLLILGGGGILFDGEASTFVLPAQIAHQSGVPVMTWAMGAGPLVEPVEQAAVQAALELAGLISVRDRGSSQLLHEIGVTRPIHVTADPGLLLEPEPFTAEMLAREGVTPGERLIGVAVREAGPAAPGLDVGHYHDLLAHVMDHLASDLDATVLFVPMEEQDREHAYSIARRVAHVQHRIRVLSGQYSARQIRGLMAHLTLAIGMRLHFLIFAASSGVPFVALPSGAKIRAFVDELGLSMPPIPVTGAAELMAAIDQAWALRASLGEEIAAHTRALVERAAQTTDLAVEILRATGRGQAAPEDIHP